MTNVTLFIDDFPLAREPEIQKRAMEVFLKLVDDTGFEQTRLDYEEMERSIERWSNQMESKQAPKRKEIDHFRERL